MDVSEEIRNNFKKYGAGPSTEKKYLAATKSINFATGGSIHKAETFTVDKAPATVNYKDEFGLFGIENYYVKIEFKDERTATPLEAGHLYKVELKNNYSGNKWQTIWVDIALYGKDRKTKDYLYIDRNDYFYVGVHARNTRRLPYDFDIEIGYETKEKSSIQSQNLNIN